MKFSVAFKGLPFEPEKRQVIYVENLYDERINALVKANYQQVKWIFQRASLDFIYLPMFFNDEETKEKVLYYAPYLTTEIIEKAELRSSYLLGYMSHGENREKITPSLIYSPKKDNEEWIFQGHTFDIAGDERSLTIQWFEDVAAEIEEELSEEESNKTQILIPVSDKDDGVLYQSDNNWVDEDPKVEYSSTPGLWDKFERGLKKYSNKCVEEEESYLGTTHEPAPSSLDEILDEDVRETLEELENKIERLRLLGIPLDVIVAFVARYETISRLRITDDFRIFLPDYNNIEVKMPALYKAVYLLFIFHRKEGIVLQQLEKHHSELVLFYSKTKGIEQLTPKHLDSINKLESSWDDDGSIYVVLSRIKKLFKNAIDEHLAKHYYIEGRPGEPYNIALSQDLIIWEDEYE
jgi:hypothetical protein